MAFLNLSKADQASYGSGGSRDKTPGRSRSRLQNCSRSQEMMLYERKVDDIRFFDENQFLVLIWLGQGRS